MRGQLSYLACLAVCLHPFTTHAQSPTLNKAANAVTASSDLSAPTAFVYVSSNYSGSNNEVVGYTANAAGQLLKIAGSPWADNIVSMAANGTILFGSDNVPNDNGRNIYSYRIESNGALKYIGATDIQKPAGNGCASGSDLLLDHTGAYLYQFTTETCYGLPAYLSFAVDKTTGLVSYLGTTDPTLDIGPPLTMSANNQFAYAAGGGNNSGIVEFRKQASGNLVTIPGSQDYDFPLGEPEYVGYSYIAAATADTTNHLAINFYSISDDLSLPNVDQIATYAVNTTTGLLSTNSTFENMPVTEVGSATWQTMAPSGKLLAVGGPNGLQIFNFNPDGQASANTGLITHAPIDQMYWDNNNHLYAISNADGTIHVFTVTPTEATETAGSPYFVAHPVALLVQPR